GGAHRPVTPSGAGVENLRLASGVNGDRMDDRKDLLGKFDTARREIDASGTMKGMDSFTGRAFDMIASGVVRTALDLKHEDPKTRDRYKGVEQFRTARRLAEAGGGCGDRGKFLEVQVPEGPAVQGAAVAQHDLSRDGH